MQSNSIKQQNKNKNEPELKNKQIEKKLDGSYISVKITGAYIDALIDTGTTESLMNENTAKILKLKIKVLINTAKYDLVLANGSDIKIIGETRVDMYLNGVKFCPNVAIARELNPYFLLGADFLSANEALIDYRTGMLSLLDDFLYAPLQSVCDESMCATLMRTQCIKPYTEITLPVHAPKHLNNTSVILEESAFAKRYPIVVASVLTFVKNNKALCRIANMNPYMITLQKGLKIAKILQKYHILSVEKVSNLPKMNSQEVNIDIPSRAELYEFQEKYGFNICPSLDENKCLQMLRLLYKYRSVFARDVTEIKACKGPPLKLDVHTNRKTFQR